LYIHMTIRNKLKHDIQSSAQSDGLGLITIAT